jgi:membrane protein DedA with SNARE-associated domain
MRFSQEFLQESQSNGSIKSRLCRYWKHSRGHLLKRTLYETDQLSEVPSRARTRVTVIVVMVARTRSATGTTEKKPSNVDDHEVSREELRTNKAPISLKQCIAILTMINVIGKVADCSILVLGQLPTLLLLLNANDVNLTIASAANVDFKTFVLIGVLRRVVEDAAYFFTARWYGEEVEVWLKGKGYAKSVARAERVLRKYGPVMLLAIPGALSCFAYGVSGRGESRKRTFFLFDGAGAALRVCLFRVVGGTAKTVLKFSVVKGTIDLVLRNKEVIVAGTTAVAIGAGSFYYYYFF